MAERTIAHPYIICEDCGASVPKRAPRHKVCEACSRERKREHDRRYAAANRERLAQKTREWARQNPERIKERYEQYKRLREENPGLVRQQRADEYTRNAERIKERARLWYKQNREAVLAKHSSPEGRRRARDKMRKKMEDPLFRAYAAISRHIRGCLTDKKSCSWPKLVGYSLEELRRHLERQFLQGMSWANYGGGRGRWHIDHIVPRKAFVFSSINDPEFKACWALTNLRPMWSHENISKHAKRTHLL